MKMAFAFRATILRLEILLADRPVMNMIKTAIKQIK